MLDDVNYNRLLLFLLLNNNISMHQLLLEFENKDDMLDSLSKLSKEHSDLIDIDINSDLTQIKTEVKNNKELYRKLNSDKFYNFNEIKCRRAYLLNKLIEDTAYLNIENLGSEMNVSRSTVNNDIKSARNIIRKYNSKIEGIPNRGIHYVGDEFSKRLILIYEVFDYFPLSDSINEELIEKVKEISFYYSLNIEMKMSLYKAALVTSLRIKNGNELKNNILMYKNFEENSEVLRNFILSLNKIFDINIKNKDVDFISYPINTRNSSYIEGIDNKENEKHLRIIVNKMSSEIKRRFMIHIDEEKFFEKVKFHILFLINRLVFRIPSKDIFTSQIKIRFPLAFELAKISMNVLYKEYNLLASNADISYLAVYFALILDEREILSNDIGDDKKVAIITNNGRSTFELIKRQIQDIVGPNSSIDFLTLMDFKNNDISKYSILFSTENIITDKHLPIIEIEGIVDEVKVSEEIIEIKKQSIKPIYKLSKLCEINVKILDEKASYKIHVEKIVNDLVQNKIASEDLYNNFLEKESVSSMIYQNETAFPHIVDKLAKEIVLSLGIIKKPTENIKIIFFLLIPENLLDEEENTLVKIYEEVFNMISDKNIIRRLTLLDSAVELNFM